MGYLQCHPWLAKLCNIWLRHIIQLLLDRSHHWLASHDFTHHLGSLLGKFEKGRLTCATAAFEVDVEFARCCICPYFKYRARGPPQLWAQFLHGPYYIYPVHFGNGGNNKRCTASERLLDMVRVTGASVLTPRSYSIPD
jgi:hypothetical protein